VTAPDRFWMMPRRLAKLLEDGEITRTEWALLAYIGAATGGLDGISVTLDHLAALLDVSSKTVSRALAKLGPLGLLEADLVQGQRRPFRLRLGPVAVRQSAASDTTSDMPPPHPVRSDFGQGGDDSAPGAPWQADSDLFDFGLSRARVETETDTEDQDQDPASATTPSRGHGGWPEGLGRRTLDDLLAACQLVEDLQNGVDSDTLRAFVTVELAEHPAADFDYVADKLATFRLEGFGNPPEPIRSEAAVARGLLQDIDRGYESTGHK
jgi:DNA-binding MarR family transcriptional regulator